MNATLSNALSGLDAARWRLVISAASISATEPNRDGVASAPPPYRVSRVEQPVLPAGWERQGNGTMSVSS